MLTFKIAKFSYNLIGTLLNDTYLKDAQKIDIDRIGEYNCLNLINIPHELHNGPKQTLRLPIKIVAMPNEQRVMIRPAKILFFNR